MNSRPVKRIEDVIRLRTSQFSEDAGPMSHPVRPDSYMKMENFYTVTVYEKGAEVIRLYSTLLGKEGFRKGMDKYFERHDGQVRAKTGESRRSLSIRTLAIYFQAYVALPASLPLIDAASHFPLPLQEWHCFSSSFTVAPCAQPDIVVATGLWQQRWR